MPCITPLKVVPFPFTLKASAPKKRASRRTIKRITFIWISLELVVVYFDEVA